MMYVLLPRVVAKQRGIKMFYTADPCSKGHFCARWTVDTKCYVCARQQVRDRYKENPEKEKLRKSTYGKRPEVRQRNAEQIRERRKKEPERFREYDKTKYLKIRSDPEKLSKERTRQLEKQKKAYQDDPEKFRLRAKNRYAANVDVMREKCREYKRRNPDVIRQLNLKHNPKDRAARKQRLPKWVTKDDIQMMSNIYKEARKLGMHVDHIIPLQGKLVSGLHVPSNLQLLTPSENCAKKNRYEVEL